MIRVFPRKTNATPLDKDVYFTGPPLERLKESTVHVSATFTWDIPKAKILADQWSEQKYSVTLGGPALDDPGESFTPGLYITKGYIFTSRGCNNNCWFCKTPKREGKIRELPITEGWRVLDSNLLQCSEQHIRDVFSMLRKQRMPISFLGGLEARILQDWHVDLLSSLTIAQCYLAYDTPDDYEPLVCASKKIFKAFSPNSHRFLCYILIGYKGDNFEAAEKRCRQVMDLGFVPFAMLYRNEKGRHDQAWIHFQSHWANPMKIYGKKPKEKMELFYSVNSVSSVAK